MFEKPFFKIVILQSMLIFLYSYSYFLFNFSGNYGNIYLTRYFCYNHFVKIHYYSYVHITKHNAVYMIMYLRLEVTKTSRTIDPLPHS